MSGLTVGTCPGCGYPVMGLHPCAACAPLMAAALGVVAQSTLMPDGPVVAA
jgi:hypothetical protein